MIVWLVLIFLALSLVAAAFVIAPALLSRAEGRRAARYWSAGGAGIVVLLSGLGMYSVLGRPDHALLSLKTEPDPTSYFELVTFLARTIRERPNDIQGWTILGSAYLAFGEVEQSAAAYERAVNLLNSQGAPIPVDLVSNFAVAQVLQGGEVSPDLEDVFRQVLLRDPANADARYHIGFAHAQRGENEAALALWEPLMAESESGAYWRANLPFQIAALSGEAPSIAGTEGVGAPSGQAPNAQGAGPQPPNVRAMVDGLAARLSQEPDDLEGWTMLIRAYSVLGEIDNARGALGSARDYFADNEAAQDALAVQARESSLE